MKLFKQISEDLQGIKLRIKFIVEAFKFNPIDLWIALLGVVGLVAWIGGVTSTFLAIGFTLYAIYTVFRIHSKKE